MGHDRLVGLWMTLSAPWQACLEEAWGAYCAGSIPVGAVTDSGGHILTRPCHCAFERDGEVSDLQVSPLAHADVAALAVVDGLELDERLLRTLNAS